MSGLIENNDFLSQAKSSTENNVEPIKKKRRTALEVEMDEYPEYYALTPYQRKCLVATNYWNIMYGNKPIDVPPSDKHYEKYFDYKCYDRYYEYQKQKKREAEYDAMIKRHREESDLRNNKVLNELSVVENIIKTENNDKPNGNVVIENKVAEVKDNIVIQKKEPEPIKQNIVPEKKQKTKRVNEKKSHDDITPSLF